MRRRLELWVVTALLTTVLVLVPAVVAGAQDSGPPSTFPQPSAEATADAGGPDSTEGELRVAQIGLIAVAVVAAAMVVAYWRFTGREARIRFEREAPRVETRTGGAHFATATTADLDTLSTKGGATGATSDAGERVEGTVGPQSGER